MGHMNTRWIFPDAEMALYIPLKTEDFDKAQSLMMCYNFQLSTTGHFIHCEATLL